jgi:hypothetical protein
MMKMDEFEFNRIVFHEVRLRDELKDEGYSHYEVESLLKVFRR